MSLLFGALFSITTAVSIAFVEPIFQVLFNQQRTVTLSAQATWLEQAKFHFYNTLAVTVIDGVSRETALLRLGVLIVGMFLLKNIVKYVGITVNTLLNERMIKSIRDDVFAKMLALSTDFFVSRKTGGLVSLITNDVAMMNATIAPATTTLVREPLQIVIFICALLAISPYLTLVAFSTSVVALVLIRVATKYLRRYAERMQHAMANYTSVLQEAISGIRIVKAFSMERRVLRMFTEQTQAYARTASKYQRAFDIVPAVSEMFAILALAVVLFIGGREVFAGRMQSQELMTFLFMLFSVMSPITNVASLPAQVQRGLVAATTIFGILDQEPSVKSGTETISGFQRELTVENVSFRYGERPVLQDISFTVRKGQKIALVGSSGSGKSTLCDLIIRLYDPQQGVIRLDGVDIRTLTFASYRRLFGVVSQEPVLFNDTVANNIRFGMMHSVPQHREAASINTEHDSEALEAEAREARTEDSWEQIRQAARIAHAEDFILKLPNGFETLIGDRGVLLSGGQRQRLAIARALVGNPEILIFDEATSALDSESEKLVQEAIHEALKGRTAIMIAHRLSTILHADEILVIEQGRIVERGSHEVLLAHNGVYKKLYDIQFGAGQKALSGEAFWGTS